MLGSDPLFMLYAQACEGDLTAGQPKLNQVAERLIEKGVDLTDTFEFAYVCGECGVNFGHLTYEEIQYVLQKAEEIAG